MDEADETWILPNPFYWTNNGVPLFLHMGVVNIRDTYHNRRLISVFAHTSSPLGRVHE